MATNPLRDRLEKLPEPPKLAVTVYEKSGKRNHAMTGPWSGQVDPFYRTGRHTPYHEERFGYAAEHEDTGLELHRLQDFSGSKPFTMAFLISTVSDRRQVLFHRSDRVTEMRLEIEPGTGRVVDHVSRVDGWPEFHQESMYPVAEGGWWWVFWRHNQTERSGTSSRISLLGDGPGGEVSLLSGTIPDQSGTGMLPPLRYTSPVFLLRSGPGGQHVTGQSNPSGGVPFKGRFGGWALWDSWLEDNDLHDVAQGGESGQGRRVGFDTGWGVTMR